MTKHYGRSNKGFAKGRITQMENAIRARRAKGETGQSSKRLAEMMDHLYGTECIILYHSGLTKAEINQALFDKENT